MNSILLGMIAGVALALLNFLASGFYSSRVTSRSQMTSVVLVVIGFVVRLTMVGIVFYILTRVKWIHFIPFSYSPVRGVEKGFESPPRNRR